MFRDMRRTKQLLPDPEVVEMLRSATSGVLAVHGDDEYPYTVPMSFAYEDGRLYFHAATTGHKLDSIERCDKVSFCVIETDDVVQSTFTTHYRSVVVFGRARMLADDEKRHALRCLAQKYSPDFVSKADDEIDGAWGRTSAFEVAIEHMTGKAAIELVGGDR